MNENSQHSVSEWLVYLKRGDETAAQDLWERYCERLWQLADRYLRGAPRRIADEEDVVVASFQQFCAGAKAGRFPQLADRDDLWQVLSVITQRRAVDQIKRENRQRRGAGGVRGHSAFLNADEGSEVAGIEQVIDNEPTPEHAALITDELRRMLSRLDNDGQRKVALLKMQGYTNDEIATQLGMVTRSIERKVRGIRLIWEDELPS